MSSLFVRVGKLARTVGLTWPLKHCVTTAQMEEHSERQEQQVYFYICHFFFFLFCTPLLLEMHFLKELLRQIRNPTTCFLFKSH